jgi:alkaline phosphatase
VAPGPIENPTLADSSVAALEVLSRDTDGFFLLIEQGHVDWANHGHDFARAIGCVADLDRAVRSVVDFIDRPNDEVDWTNTTLIVTADHSNGYLRFNSPLAKGELPPEIDPNQVLSGQERIRYYADGHTSELTTVYARGYAAVKFYDYEEVYPGLGIIDDTSIYRVTLDATLR